MSKIIELLSSKKYILIAVIFVLSLLTLLTSVRVVDTGEVGVVTQYGRVTGRELREGIHLVLPLGIQNVTKYDVKVQKQQSRAEAASKDLQDVNSVLVINYTVSPDQVGEIHQTIGRDYRSKLIDPAVQEVFKAASAKYDATQLITDRAGVKKDAYELLRDRLSVYGINVTDLSITDFSFSEDFSDAIEAKQVAQQNAERAKFNLDAAKTDAEAQQVQSVTLSDLYLRKQAIDKWDGKLPDYVGGGDSIFNIPLQ